MGFGFLPSLDVHLYRQVTNEVADHPHMRLAEVPGALSGSGGAQLRRQRLAGQGAALTELGGLAYPPAGLSTRDPQPAGQRRRQPAAQLLLAGLLGDLIDQGMFDARQLAPNGFAALQQGHAFRGGQGVEGQVLQP